VGSSEGNHALHTGRHKELLSGAEKLGNKHHARIFFCVLNKLRNFRAVHPMNNLAHIYIEVDHLFTGIGGHNGGPQGKRRDYFLP
jgi:hypothetical protein